MAEKRRYHHGDLREGLVEGVRQLVEEKGADGFTIAEACRRAGVSTAAPYKHFTDRHEIMRAVALGGMERLRARMQAALAAHPAGDTARIAALGAAYTGFAADEPGVFRMMFSLTEDHGDDPALTETGDSMNRLVEGAVADHMGLDPESEGARLRAYALWCFVHGHCFLMLDGKRDNHGADIPEAALLNLVGERMLT